MNKLDRKTALVTGGTSGLVSLRQRRLSTKVRIPSSQADVRRSWLRR